MDTKMDINPLPATQEAPINVNGDKDISNIFIYIKTVWFLLILIVGVLFNSLSCTIIIKQGLIKTSIWIYIAALSITDSGTLIMFFIYEFSKEPVSLLGNILSKNSTTCKTITALVFAVGGCSQYLLTIMTVSRCLLIIRPYSQPPTPKQTLGYVFLIIIIMFLIFAPFLATTFDVIKIPVHINSTDIVKVCTILPKYSDLYTYFVKIDLVIYFIIPLVLILTSNCVIVFKLYQRSRESKINRSQDKYQEDVKILYMLMAVSLFFILCTTPFVIYQTLVPYIYGTDLGEAYSPDNIAWVIIGNIVLLNNCCNFFLYVASGKIFRNQLKQFFRNIFKYLTIRRGSDGSNQTVFKKRNFLPRNRAKIEPLGASMSAHRKSVSGRNLSFRADCNIDFIAPSTSGQTLTTGSV